MIERERAWREAVHAAECVCLTAESIISTSITIVVFRSAGRRGESILHFRLFLTHSWIYFKATVHPAM